MTYGTTAPNGLLLSDDERTLYVIQSDYDGVRELRAYPLLDDDTLGEHMVLHSFGEDFRGCTEDWMACVWTPRGTSLLAVVGVRLGRDR